MDFATYCKLPKESWKVGKKSGKWGISHGQEGVQAGGYTTFKNEDFILFVETRKRKKKPVIPKKKKNNKNKTKKRAKCLYHKKKVSIRVGFLRKHQLACAI